MQLLIGRKMNTIRPASLDIKAAMTELRQVKSKQVDNGFSMLCAHYNAEGRAISAEELALSVGMKTHHSGNNHYGAFAHRLCKLLGYEPPEASKDHFTRWTYLLATYPGDTNAKGHGLWILRPEVGFALEELGLVRKRVASNPVDDIEAKQLYLDTLCEKDRMAMIRARLGQGDFRKRLLGFWGACSVTGCTTAELLVASHVKPWRDCEVSDALDVCNGLLLTPNLDKVFDLGYISFQDTGEIIFSLMLTARRAFELGISLQMKLQKDLIAEQRKYMQYHRSNILLP